MRNTKKGFTLIELLIVITIIGILAAALLPTILGAPQKGRDAARQKDVNGLVTAVEAYVADGGSYSDLTDGCASASSAQLLDYIPGGQMPTDPQGPHMDTTTGLYEAVGDCHYFVCVNSGSRNYAVAGYLEDATKGNHTPGGNLTADICDGSIISGSGPFFAVIL